MAGFQTMDMPRPRMASGTPSTPIVNIDLVRPRIVPVKINPSTGLATVTPALVEKMRAMRAAGQSHRSISQELNASQGTVYDHTRDVEPPSSGWSKGNERVSFDVVKALRMRRAGFSYREMATEFGLSRTALRNKFRELDGEARIHGRSGRAPATRAMEVLSGRLGIKRGDICRDPDDGELSNRPEIVKARHLVFWLLHRRLNMSSAEVGDYLGGFDHSTVMNGVRRVEGIARTLTIDLEGQPMRVLRKLLVAEWPTRKAR